MKRTQSARKSFPVSRRRILSNAAQYRSFLKKFLKHPHFNEKYVSKSLETVYKTTASRQMAYLALKQHKNKIKKDLEILQTNPDAFIETIDEYICKSESNHVDSTEETSSDSSSVEDNIPEPVNKKPKPEELIDICSEVQMLKEKMSALEKILPKNGNILDSSSYPERKNTPPLIDISEDDDPVDRKVNFQMLSGNVPQNIILQTSENLPSSSGLQQKTLEMQYLNQLQTPVKQEKGAANMSNLMLESAAASGNVQILRNLALATDPTQNIVAPFFNNSQHNFNSRPLILTIPAGNLQFQQNYANGSPWVCLQPSALQHLRLENSQETKNLNR